MNTIIKNTLIILPAFILSAIPAISMENLSGGKDEVKATMAYFEIGDRNCEKIYDGLCDSPDLLVTGSENNESINPEFSEETVARFTQADQMAKEIYESLLDVKALQANADTVPTLTGTMSAYQVELVLVAVVGICTALNTL